MNPYWDPHADPYDLPSNVLPHVSPLPPAAEGSGDHWVEPFDFRLCFTNSPGNKLNFSRPDSYNASEWELWRRLYRQNPPATLSDAGLSCLGGWVGGWGVGRGGVDAWSMHACMHARGVWCGVVCGWVAGRILMMWQSDARACVRACVHACVRVCVRACGVRWRAGGAWCVEVGMLGILVMMLLRRCTRTMV